MNNRAIFPWQMVVCFLLAWTAANRARADETYDLVLRGGTIVDGSGNPWFIGDVAIRGDRIVAVGHVPAGTGRREVDANKLVVSPGFIDIHSHSDTLLLEDGHAQSKIRQGVTTEVLGEGTSAGPRRGKMLPPVDPSQAVIARWATLGNYFEAIERAGVSVNVASYAGMDNVWQCVMGTSFDRPTPAQLGEMKSLLDEAMTEGALGMSSLLAMPPGSLATTDEIVELCQVVARRGGIFSSHIRHEGVDVVQSVEEAIAIGERAGLPVDIIHLKIADQKLWGRMNELVALIDEARRRGVNVQANVYPYTRGNNNLSSIIPPWAHEGGRPRMIERLKDPSLRERLKRDIRNGLPGWYNHYTAVGGDWSRMLIAGRGRYEGLTMDRVIALRAAGKDSITDPLDVLFELLVEENGTVSTVFSHHTENDMNLALVQPWCSIGSDGSAYSIEGPLRRGFPHPRSFGTFPRVLGEYVRQRHVLQLEDAVRKMTSLNGAKLGIFDRGLLRAGNYADVTVFDPSKVIDRATYAEPFQYNDGIEYVVVNGHVVLERGRHTGERPGRALRHQVK
jgi:N-acyl-D-aspartate/D-glutamate deacylase